MPRFEDMVSFLEHRAVIESDQSFQRQIHSQKQTQYHKQNQFSKNTSTKHNSKPSHLCNKATISHNSKTSQVTCHICSEQQTLLSCSTFQGMSPKERCNEIRKTSFCHNCSKGYHRTIDYRANTCEKCQKRHHILLHFEREFPEGSKPSTLNSATTLVSFQTQSTTQVILGTALVDILNSKGEYQSCRALLDSCSQCNSMTEKLANALGL